MNGLRSLTVKLCRAKGGGLTGNGCVGQTCSPGISVLGTGFSVMGQSGSPVTRLKTQRNPSLLATATASTFLPSCSTVRSFGADVLS